MSTDTADIVAQTATFTFTTTPGTVTGTIFKGAVLSD